MDRAKDLEMMIETIELDDEKKISELNDLQLALVGGGSGDTILH